MIPELQSVKKNHTVLAAIIVALSLITAPQSAFAGKDTLGQDCALKGQKLQGRVKIVDSFPDFKVRVVSSFPDLKVKKVKRSADRCGEWQIVESFPDFKIQLVDSFPDFTIKYVDSFPGKP